MKGNRQKDNFRSLRLKNYDYSRPGAYFITVCVKDRRNLFGCIIKRQMELNQAGCLIQKVWDTLPNRFPLLRLDAFVIMPNHIHAILVFTGQMPTRTASSEINKPPLSIVTKNENRECVDAGLALPFRKACLSKESADRTECLLKKQMYIKHSERINQRHSLGDVVCTFKSLSTLEINRLLRKIGPIWQRNYYEHVIRNPQSLNVAREYIRNNPKNWVHDKENQEGFSGN